MEVRIEYRGGRVGSGACGGCWRRGEGGRKEGGVGRGDRGVEGKGIVGGMSVEEGRGGVCGRGFSFKRTIHIGGLDIFKVGPRHARRDREAQCHANVACVESDILKGV